jgi:hypothetical protein
LGAWASSPRVLEIWRRILSAGESKLSPEAAVFSESEKHIIVYSLGLGIQKFMKVMPDSRKVKNTQEKRDAVLRKERKKIDI